MYSCIVFQSILITEFFLIFLLFILTFGMEFFCELCPQLSLPSQRFPRLRFLHLSRIGITTGQHKAVKQNDSSIYVCQKSVSACVSHQLIIQR